MHDDKLGWEAVQAEWDALSEQEKTRYMTYSCAMSPLALTVFTMNPSMPSDVSATAANLLPPRYGSSQGTRLLPANSCTDAAEPTSHTNA